MKKVRKFKIEIQSLDGHSSHIILLRETPVICGGIPRVRPGPWVQELRKKKIVLTDWEQSKIDNPDVQILIGSDFWGKLVTSKPIKVSSSLVAVNTVFGWTLSGQVSSSSRDGENNVAMSCVKLFLGQGDVSELWNLETIGIKDPAESKTQIERDAEAVVQFTKTVSRKEDGRYSIALPWVGGEPEIPTNKIVAMKRLSSQIQKLNPEKFAVYDKIFKAWIEEKFIEVVPDADKNKPSHYLPHRPVFKPESVTTPVRPVFDASCKVGRAPSLNECLEKGPNLMELIPSILLRFRENEIGVVSDIRKAFQMIEITPRDRDFLRFLWWEDFTCSKVIEFRHKRVVFGINCSPFILAAVLEKHLKSVKEEWQQTAKKLLESLYVDNCVTSVRNIQEYEDFKRESIDIMEDAKMDLCQWERSFVEMDQDSDQPPDTMVLGLIWNKKEDSLRCKVKVPELSEKLTKREILSKVQQIFDPIGFSSPTTLQPKVMLQEVWANKLGWDDELPDDIVTNYKKWYEELACLTEVRIPRWISCGADMEKKNIQLHVFCDASQTAYAAVIFLRVSSEDDVKIHLLQAKSRVAPLKKTTIPRLELLGCTIAARLKNSVATSLNMRNVPTTFWSDSTTALSWIQRNNEWGTFVGNRVREILKMSDAKQWKHVPGKLNPADLPSRGCNARELVQSRWWEGPDWLREDQNSWPSQDFEISEEEITAEKKKSSAVKMTVVTPHQVPWYAERFSSFYKNVCVVGWMKRFHHNATRSRCERIHSRNLTVKEVEAAEATIMKLIQQDSFPKGTNIIGGIEVIIREDGLICAKTKLLQSDESESFRKPVLLPKFHPIVEQLIREEHCMNGHAGAQFLMGHLRKKYWILQGRQAIKKVIHSCTICKRFSMKKPEVPAGLLPSVRVKMGKVFEVTGVDLAGPLFLKNKTKVWIWLFTCAVYRCVHLELVGSISTESFLLALERFIARRGRPTTIYSDNGTNFTGASHYFKELNWKKIEKETAMKRINWIFNPPSAPWWGGWWERLIKIVKDLLRRMLGNSRVDYQQLESCICSVESVVNARPLTFVTEDPEDLIPLTPAMFLQDNQETNFPEAELLEGDMLRMKSKGMLELRNQLRSRFRREYLSQLVQKAKTMKKPFEFKPNDLVLVGYDNKKRLGWPMGRILNLFPGKDGKFRVAKIRTKNGVITRPLQRLYPLEITGNSVECPVPPNLEKAEEKATEWEKEEPVKRTRHGRQTKKPDRLGVN
ncbi:uncharacterized protein LOC110854898 [Folsomia candida]|uniref:Pro-Pol polyprotein n=1 Tax=Folsomia candida TaxID=158441 RepID=A0A226DV18_FOLCA|nr:uncharacterized protein LOC110854898 [Folsomia candida]OXA48910.1 Pro-Pol polyprotein [Folsomia candida]